MECESVSNRTRSGTPRPGHAAPAATRARYRAAYVRGRHTLRHGRPAAGTSQRCQWHPTDSRLPVPLRPHPARHPAPQHAEPDSGTRSLAADVCLHMPYH